MTESMIERVAEAIEGAYRNEDDSHAAMLRMAIAAVRAMREPTQRVLEAGFADNYGHSAVPAWEAMIDKILSDTEERG